MQSQLFNSLSAKIILYKMLTSIALVFDLLLLICFACTLCNDLSAKEAPVESLTITPSQPEPYEAENDDVPVLAFSIDCLDGELCITEITFTVTCGGDDCDIDWDNVIIYIDEEEVETDQLHLRGGETTMAKESLSLTELRQTYRDIIVAYLHTRRSTTAHDSVAFYKEKKNTVSIALQLMRKETKHTNTRAGPVRGTLATQVLVQTQGNFAILGLEYVCTDKSLDTETLVPNNLGDQLACFESSEYVARKKNTTITSNIQSAGKPDRGRSTVI